MKLVQEANLRRIGAESSVNLFEAREFLPVLESLWREGVAGPVWADLVKVDNYLANQRLTRRVMLRFLHHYLDEPEYQAVSTSLELVSLLQDRASPVPKRSTMISGLYNRLDHLRHGRRVFNQLSSGRLEHLTYPEMRALETRLVPAGRAAGADKERIGEIFYASIQPDPSKLWVNSSDDPVAVFGEIADRLVGSHDGRRPLPFLDVYSVGAAVPIAEHAIGEFTASYRGSLQIHARVGISQATFGYKDGYSAVIASQQGESPGSGLWRGRPGVPAGFGGPESPGPLPRSRRTSRAPNRAIERSASGL